MAMPAEERKQEIYAALDQLLNEVAYENVTMAQIAAKAGMSKKTLYVYFADKDALLQAFVASTYVWPQKAVQDLASDPVEAFAIRMHAIADHVLCESHIRLCRLAIGEGARNAGIAETFFQLGILANRQSLVQAMARIDSAHKVLKLDNLVLVEMIVGATVGQHLVTSLLTGQLPALSDVHQSIDALMASMFCR